MKTLFVIVMMLNISLFAGEKTYGKKLTLTEITKVSEIMEHPENFVGKKVQIEGRVLEVCPKRGCWMELSSDKDYQKMRIKVDDGEIVFPLEAKGKKATAEGYLYKIELNQEEAVGYLKHQAEELGKPFDPTTVTEGLTLYQIKGQGALIK